MPKRKTTLATLKLEYDAIRPRAERLLLELQRQLDAIIQASAIPLAFPIEARVKSWESILLKRRRLALRPGSATDIHDLCGLRIVTLFRRDADKIAEEIAARFVPLTEEDTAARLRDDRFGYASIHLVVEIPAAWRNLPTLSDLAGLRAEIQVRSVAQHLWAAASHALQYKTEASAPPPLKRSLSRVSALLEVVDLELARVIDERIGYRELVGTKTNVLLNVDALEKTLDAILPAKNKTEDELYEDLLDDLLHFEIDTPLKLRALLRKHLKAILTEERATVADIRRRGLGSIITDGEERAMEQGVYFMHAGFVRIALTREFGKAWLKFQGEKFKYLREHYPLDDEFVADSDA